MSELFVNMRESRMNMHELGGAFVRLLKASRELLSRRYRNGECDSLALTRFSDEVVETEQWIANDYRNTDNHVFTFVLEKMLSEVRANAVIGQKFEIENILSGWFENGDRLLIRLSGRSLEANERYHAKNITIPRDLHELYKEAAEKWAAEWSERTSLDGRDKWYRYCGVCGRMSESAVVSKPAPAFTHTADCKAARTLGLKREGAE